jgi:hypothetical protein
VFVRGAHSFLAGLYVPRETNHKPMRHQHWYFLAVVRVFPENYCCCCWGYFYRTGTLILFPLQSTGKRSALGTIREAELYGGVLSSSLSREHLALTAEFLRGDEYVLLVQMDRFPRIF